jgi:hypothetical protein
MVYFIESSKEEFIKTYPTLYRFSTIERVLQQLKSGVFTFINPTSWEDPYERYYIEKEFVINTSNHKLPAKDRIFCVCVSGTSNSEAFWKVYSPLGNGIRLTFNTKDFISVLEAISGPDFYVGKVDYRITKDFPNLNALNVDRHILIEEITTDMIGDQQLKLLLKKRISYLYENEVRIISIPKLSRSYKKIWEPSIDLRVFTTKYQIDPRLDRNHYELLKDAFQSKYNIPLTHSKLLKVPLNSSITL